MGEYSQSQIHSVQGLVLSAQSSFTILKSFFILDDNHWFMNNVIDNHQGYIQLKLAGFQLQQRGWQYFNSRYGWQDDDTLTVKVTSRK